MEKKDSAEKAVREIRRKTRRRFSAEEKVRIVIEGLRGEESIASRTARTGEQLVPPLLRSLLESEHATLERGSNDRVSRIAVHPTSSLLASKQLVWDNGKLTRSSK
jgi:transposase-like protein